MLETNSIWAPSRLNNSNSILSAAQHLHHGVEVRICDAICENQSAEHLVWIFRIIDKDVPAKWARAVGASRRLEASEGEANGGEADGEEVEDDMMDA